MKRICLFVCAICALNIINAQQREKYEFMRNLPVYALYANTAPCPRAWLRSQNSF